MRNISRTDNLRVYLHLIKMGLIEMWEFKAEFIGDLIRLPISVSLHVLIFIFLYQNTDIIDGFNQGTAISYILIVSMIANGFSTQHMSRIINEHIVEGDLIEYLVKPVNIHFMYFSNQIAYRLFMTVIYIIAYIIAIFFFPILIIPQLVNIVPAIIIIFLGYLISLQFFYLIGLFSFWVGSVSFLNRLMLAIQQLLGGRYFPVSWLPISLIFITSFLPFSILYNIPALILVNSLPLILSMKYLGIGIGWLIILQLMIHFIFKKGLHLFDGAGD